jgi:pyruvate dehydrogenase E2 component (dihydrolipoamide acetyltransferase)
MVTLVKLPKLSISGRGELVEWKKSVGDAVEEGEPIAVLESEKATTDVEASVSGTLLAVYVEAGEEIEIEIGRPVAAIGEADETPPSPEEVSGAAETAGEPAAEAGAAAESSATEAPKPTTDEVKATPKARKLAADHDVDLTTIEGTGPQGSVSVEDVEAAIEAGAAAPELPEGVTVTETRELTGIRRTVAERMTVSAREIPHAMGSRELDLTALQAARKQLEEDRFADLSLNDLLLYAVVKTLEEFPEFNAYYRDGEHVFVDEINLGYAIDSPRGLIVPVLKDLSGVPIDELAERRRALVDRVMEDEHTPEDLQGGTFTVTNVGVFGFDVSYSLINPPQVSILAFGRRKPAPVEVDGEIEHTTVSTFTLQIDHRVLDGGDSGRFMNQLAEYVETPETLFPHAL